MMQGRSIFSAAMLTAIALVGCGGGGDSGPVAATMSFPLASGYRAFVQAGHTGNFTVSGSCGGTAAFTTSAAAGSIQFEGQTVATDSVTQTINLTGCTPATSTAIQTEYISQTTYLPVGSSETGVEYVVAQATPVLPATVKVGDSGQIAAYNVYGSSAKTSVVAVRTATFAVTADTPTSVLFTVTQRETSGSTVTATQMEVYRLDASGNVSVVSYDLVGGTIHLVLTKT